MKCRVRAKSRAKKVRFTPGVLPKREKQQNSKKLKYKEIQKRQKLLPPPLFHDKYMIKKR